MLPLCATSRSGRVRTLIDAAELTDTLPGPSRALDASAAVSLGGAAPEDRQCDDYRWGVVADLHGNRF
jgi:hypothetical protein